MQRFAVIGLGRFGSRLAKNLAAAGEEVVAIDRSRQRVEAIRDQVTLAVALDATDEHALAAQRIEEVDVAIVTMGDAFEMSVLTTSVLKHLGVPRIVSRAVSPTQARILSRIGASQIVNPEDESADRWATRLMSPHVLKQYDLDDGHSILEVRVPATWVGKSLIEIGVRRELGLHVLGIKRTVTDPTPDDRVAGDDASDGPSSVSAARLHVPIPDQPLLRDDILVVMGDDEALTAIPNDQ